MRINEIAIAWAIGNLGMEKAKTNQPGHGGILPDGKKIAVKSKSMGHILILQPTLTFQKKR